MELLSMSLSSRLKSLFWWWPFGRVAEISAGELHRQLGGGTAPQIVDVRSRLEWRRNRIAGAVSVPIPELKHRLADLELDSARPIVAICLSAHRSIPAVRLLQSRGYPQAVQLRGGMLAWWRQGLPTEGDAPKG
jgi:rhodanese-related sulfurtransferase